MRTSENTSSRHFGAYGRWAPSEVVELWALGLYCGSGGVSESAKEEALMTEPRHGRYYAEELVLDANANVRDQIQDALDASDRQARQLVAVSYVPGERGGMLLFWDTGEPGFARSSG